MALACYIGRYTNVHQFSLEAQMKFRNYRSTWLELLSPNIWVSTFLHVMGIFQVHKDDKFSIKELHD